MNDMITAITAPLEAARNTFSYRIHECKKSKLDPLGSPMREDELVYALSRVTFELGQCMLDGPTVTEDLALSDPKSIVVRIETTHQKPEVESELKRCLANLGFCGEPV
jgi:hypothetical protein